VEEHPVAADPARQQGGILVLGRHGHPETLEGLEVLGLGERDAGPLPAERGVRDDPGAELLDEGDARIFEAPLLFGVPAVVAEGGVVVDDPVGRAVRRAGAGQMREAAPVLDAAEQHRLVVHRGGAGVHHRVDRIGPVLRGQQRIARVPGEQHGAIGHEGPFRRHRRSRRPYDRPRNAARPPDGRRCGRCPWRDSRPRPPSRRRVQGRP
jgi:hypothetical protein